MLRLRGEEQWHLDFDQSLLRQKPTTGYAPVNGTHDLLALKGAGICGADFASQSGAVAALQATELKQTEKQERKK
jgi:hypothetical protein